MKVVAIVQARMGSTRFPNKVMKLISGLPLIEILLRRLARSKEIDEIIVATSADSNNDPLIECVNNLGFRCFLGSESNVLERYYLAAKNCNADVIVRITGDCPLVDPEIVDQCLIEFRARKVDYLSNTRPPTYPDGLDVEIMTFSSLTKAYLESADDYEREHVTIFHRNSSDISTYNVVNDIDYSSLRWTVDEPRDIEVIRNIFKKFSNDIYFGWTDVVGLFTTFPEIFEGNKSIKRNEGAIIGKGQKLWKRAKNVIPGGNMLLSKRPEMFLPEQWPAYFSRSKGCRVWDLDGNEFIDMSIMGIGTNTLGYGNEKVDEAARSAINHGNMSTLNCPEEVLLAEKLVEMHPWSDMARLARSGGEANAIAIRIARAASGRDGVAICGYHGWHDWYLSANLADDSSLDGHLLPGLSPRGVPRSLKGTVIPFNYNDIEQLKIIIKTNDIGVIKMEVARNTGPQNDFLVKVRNLATENNIVLIFDECTSGFRETFGGLHIKYGVDPDMAMFGKALGNGYAITATIGRREIMEAAQSTFISSTFWTERIGPAAALATLNEMQKIKSWEIITEKGNWLKKNWQLLSDRHGLKLLQWGLPALAGYTFDSQNSLAYKTFITQEMLAQGYLVGNSVYLCTEHTTDIMQEYIEKLDSLFEIISECEEGRDIMSLLKGPICHSGFKRLN